MAPASSPARRVVQASHFPAPPPRNYQPPPSDTDNELATLLLSLKHDSRGGAIEEPFSIAADNSLPRVRTHSPAPTSLYTTAFGTTYNTNASVHDWLKHSCNDSTQSDRLQYSVRETALESTQRDPNPSKAGLSDMSGDTDSEATISESPSGTDEPLAEEKRVATENNTLRHSFQSTNRRENASRYNYHEIQQPRSLRFSIQAPQQVYQSQSPKKLLPKENSLQEAAKMAEEMQGGKETVRRSRKQKTMDAAIAKSTAEYMKKSGGDLEKAAGLWFARELTKSRQPWPALEEAEAAVEKMKRNRLDPKRLLLQIEEEKTKRETRKKRMRKGEKRKEDKATEPSQQSFGSQYLGGIYLDGSGTTMTTAALGAKNDGRETRY
ncbi:hypothetical protein F4678DRAFT_33569 [Xylaria arbuscula]|nr:hypothetical protein F4678DRAFT_33569 [Xylaria arbuscula]